MTRLKAMFLAVGLLVAGGTSYTLFLLRPEYAVGDAIDAGLLPISLPARLSCRVRIDDSCLDGGTLQKYVRLPLKARKSKPTSPVDFIAFDVPRAWQGCIHPVGTPAEACDLVEDGVCTDATICAAGYVPTPEVDLCACRPGDGGVCTLADGGTAPFGVTLAAGSWAGAACVRKYCGPVIAGEATADWPVGCPP